jgi:SH3-like domain-containing protein
MRRLSALALAALLAPALPVLAQEFRAVGAAASVLYDGPSERAQKRFIVVRGTPLEVVSSLGAWAKVRDFAGDVFWIPQAELTAARNVVVSRALASVRKTPGSVGELVFQAERGVMLEVVDEPAPSGWLRVRHRDGAAGFVSADEVWGR